MGGISKSCSISTLILNWDHFVKLGKYCLIFHWNVKLLCLNLCKYDEENYWDSCIILQVVNHIIHLRMPFFPLTLPLVRKKIFVWNRFIYFCNDVLINYLSIFFLFLLFHTCINNMKIVCCFKKHKTIQIISVSK